MGTPWALRDVFCFQIFKGSGGSNPPLSARKSPQTEISHPDSRNCAAILGTNTLQGGPETFTNQWSEWEFYGFLSVANYIGPRCLNYIPACSMVFGEWKAMLGSRGGRKVCSTIFVGLPITLEKDLIHCYGSFHRTAVHLAVIGESA